MKNEQTRKVKIVSVIGENRTCVPNLKQDVDILDRACSKIKIELIILHEKFGPEFIQDL